MSLDFRAVFRKVLAAVTGRQTTSEAVLYDPQEVDRRGGFTGRKGFELSQPSYSRYRNVAEIIDGRPYSGHAIDQMENRGIPAVAVENAIKNGGDLQTRPNTKGYYDARNQLKVIVNSDTGKVVTFFYGTP